MGRPPAEGAVALSGGDLLATPAIGLVGWNRRIRSHRVHREILPCAIDETVPAPARLLSDGSSEKINGEARSGSLSVSVSKGRVLGFGHEEPGTKTYY